jgi:acetyl-CoA carboxylase biotin carboxylase subunit
MNTRLQVEHPVTEEVTGIDIVKRQIEIASTGKLSLKQKDIPFFGHSIECRINAEDPSKDFLPSAGTIKTYNQPSGPGTRVDSCIFQGCKITPYYDSLIAKLICHGKDRTSAISRLKRSLDEFVIEGVSSTIDLHKKILRNEHFINSKYDVNWLSKTKFC